MRKIVIVMTYFDRLFQVNKTLETIKKSSHDNYHIIIVDDHSLEPLKIKDKNVTVIRIENKVYTNPAPAFNIGFIEALKLKPEVIIIQNAECYHYGDVLEHANRITDDYYYSYSCFSSGKDQTLDEVLQLNDIGASHDGQNAWYNHPVYRPVGYHFCTAITASNLVKINGFDERLSYGIGYDDNLLLDQVRNAGMKIEIIPYPMVVHQWHYSQPDNPRKSELVEINRTLYNQLRTSYEYRAKHLITADLCL